MAKSSLTNIQEEEEEENQREKKWFRKKLLQNEIPIFHNRNIYNCYQDLKDFDYDSDQSED